MAPSKDNAASSSTSKKSSSTIGAPAQKNQSTRKGKKAWRKNIDIEDVETGLEELRAEEREFGKPLQRHGDSELFQIDVKGDDDIRKKLPKYSKSLLTSTKILSQRSAVPAVFSRPSSSTTKKRKPVLSQEEKLRLLRMGKRARKGPFNSIMDPTEIGNGSAMLELSEAVKNSGNDDLWAAENEEDASQDEEIAMGLETVRKRKIKPPTVPHPKDIVEIPAIADPHQGTSYNPLASAYQDLLLTAHQAEEKRVEELAKMAVIKERMAKARIYEEEGPVVGVIGMKLDVPGEEAEPEPTVNEISIAKPAPERKTKAQRNKAAKLQAERRKIAAQAARKQLLASIDRAKTFRRSTEQTLAEREQARLLKRQIQREKLRGGLSGKRFGKHKVPEGDVDVQLGDDLSESLRALKPEGNLFKDRFVSLQQRALIEPRRLVLPKKRRAKIIEYEKHAWKRFE
ncbi:hypothetical protein ONZ45_g10458 [Pleurotus djamor]|nr:hypothetical protein ONZ45_g10458 [Pleurotus djamor]